MSDDLLHIIAPEGIKVGFEDLLACQAACAGCTLTHEERTRGGLWRQDIQAGAAALARAEVTDKAGVPGVREADLIGVQLFQGNHLLLPPEQIRDLIRNLAGIAGKHSNVILSTSPVGNRRLIERGLATLSEARSETGLSVDTALVLSEERDYREDIARSIAANTQAIKEHFDLTDAVLPIPADPYSLPPPEILHDRIVENGFETLALALQPTRSNANAFAAAWPDLIDWIRRLVRHWHENGGYDLMLYKNVGRTMGHARDLEPHQIPLALQRRLRRQVYVDHHGCVHFMQEGLGGDDMPLSTRFGFRPLARATEQFENNRLDMAAEESARRIWSGYLTDSRCSGCPYRGACALSGGAQMKQALGERAAAADCPIGIRVLMDELDRLNSERAQ